MDTMRLLLHHTMKQVTKDKICTKATVMKTKDALTEKYGIHIPFPPFNPVRGEYKISRAYRDLVVGIKNSIHSLVFPMKRETSKTVCLTSSQHIQKKNTQHISLDYSAFSKL